MPALRERGAEVASFGRDDDLFSGDLGHVIYAIAVTNDARDRAADAVRADVGLLLEVLARCRFESLLYLSSAQVYYGAERSLEDAAVRIDPGDPDDVYRVQGDGRDAVPVLDEDGPRGAARGGHESAYHRAAFSPAWSARRSSSGPWSYGPPSTRSETSSTWTTSPASSPRLRSGDAGAFTTWRPDRHDERYGRQGKAATGCTTSRCRAVRSATSRSSPGFATSWGSSPRPTSSRASRRSSEIPGRAGASVTARRGAEVCRACGGLGLSLVIGLGEHPVANAFVAESDRGAPDARFPLDLYVCERCALLQIPDHVPADFFRDYLYVPRRPRRSAGTSPPSLMAPRFGPHRPRLARRRRGLQRRALFFRRALVWAYVSRASTRRATSRRWPARGASGR